MANPRQKYKLGELRSESIYTMIEPSFKTLVDQIIEDEEQKSMSTYLRSLIVRDLVNRGLVTVDDLAEILAGVAA